ncbi:MULTISPECIES: ECF transporter S component [Clostridium]|uniref:ECF transporter S component n=1 Tax=Clostridium cibarium TaxID=2762247 RepID=A0ABR8PPW9_9CLOT|nr:MULTISPECIES: ECF transporter S component [Clostridium]MBD7910229.1 ECF transporter S component [Clostridium cibarium]
MKNIRILSTRDLVLTALMIALVFIAGSIIKVPTVGGFVHVGDCMVFLSVVVLGKKKGAIASAFGMLLVDVIGGYFMWAPFTFIIKGTMAYISGAIIENILKRKDDHIGFKIEYIFAFIVSGVFMVVGYFFAGTILAGFLTERLGLMEGLAFAFKDILGNIVQVTTGIIISIPLSAIILSAKKKVLN